MHTTMARRLRKNIVTMIINPQLGAPMASLFDSSVMVLFLSAKSKDTFVEHFSFPLSFDDKLDLRFFRYFDSFFFVSGCVSITDNIKIICASDLKVHVKIIE